MGALDHDNRYTLTTDIHQIPVDAALALLKATYWAQQLTRETLARAMDHSLCFGVLEGDDLIGFARVITDRATFAYITDVVIASDARGQGLGHWLTGRMLEHPDLQGLRRICLVTGDAEDLYADFGFEPGAGTLTYMERRGT
jgi:N-acetylglutamate synthase-like GNAT family acetyltransferase